MIKELILCGIQKSLKAYDIRLHSLLKQHKDEIMDNVIRKPFFIDHSTTQVELTNAFNDNRELYYSHSNNRKSKIMQIKLDNNAKINSFYVMSIENDKVKLMSFLYVDGKYTEANNLKESDGYVY